MNLKSIKHEKDEVKKWYAVYTFPRSEKKIVERLENENIEAYLPLKTTIKQWSDRRKTILEPLFTSYVFVCIANNEHHKVQNIQGVVKFVSFEGKAVTIPEKQIEYLKRILENKIEIEETDFLIEIGSKVIITSGPLSGIEGELIDKVNSKRVIIRLSELKKSIIINVPLNFLELIS